MTASISDERAVRSSGPVTDVATRVLGHPAAYALTALILLALFAAPFLTNPDRVAPTKDPAYYTWRTEALITEDPATVLGIEGPNGMFAAGYRVTAPVLGGLLRHIGGVGSLSVTIFLMVGLPVLISLLLAGFAHRYLPDPVMWHAVAFASAGMLLTPPFVGYLDNVLCLFFLAAALYVLAPARESWLARGALFVLLLQAGLTHPTTLVIFCAALGVMAGSRLVATKFDLKDVVRNDGWMLGTAFASVVATVAIWTIGIWGPSVSLAEAALPPPYGSDFFIDRMMLWVDTMRPALNGPLFLLGAGVLLVRGWSAWRDDFPRIALLWLSPLVGLFGFVAGLTYPYYRFFNTTLAWVLLIGVGAGVAIRFFISRAASGGPQRLLLVGVLAVAIVLGTNLSNGLQISGWTKEKNQWLSPESRADLDVLRAALRYEERDRPVVFVVDDEPPDPFQIYGFTKLSGNTSRYGLPAGQIDRGYLYLGDVENLVDGRPTSTGDDTYDPLSKAFLADTEEGIERAGIDPIIVVAEAFNPAGANAAVASGEAGFTSAVTSRVGTPSGSPDLWTLHDGTLHAWGPDGSVAMNRPGNPAPPPGAPVRIVRVLAGLLLLLLPGALALHRLVPGATFADALGMVPAVSLALVAIVAVVVVAVARGPFTPGIAWLSLGVSLVAGAALLLGRRSRTVT